MSREIAVVKSKLQRMNPVQQQVPYNQLFGDLVGLEQRRKALLDRPPAADGSGAAAANGADGQPPVTVPVARRRAGQIIRLRQVTDTQAAP